MSIQLGAVLVEPMNEAERIYQARLEADQDGSWQDKLRLIFELEGAKCRRLEPNPILDEFAERYKFGEA